MVRFLGIAVLCALALALLRPPAAAAPDRNCSAGWVCVKPLDRGADGVDFVAHNLKPYPLTVSVRARVRGARGRFNYEATIDVPPGGSRVAISHPATRASAADGYRYWFDWSVGATEVNHDDSYRYRLPYARGKRYYVLQGYGSRFSHTGLERYSVDFDMRVGTPVHAARGGVVARVQEAHNKGCWRDGCGRYANYVVILHPDGTTGEYYHLRKDGAVVEEGERVTRGQLIAFSGNTGHTTMPHLHFGVYKAAPWGRTESLPVTFVSADGPVSKPRHGPGYFAE